MKQRARGILHRARLGMVERSPNVIGGALPPLALWPRDPEQILHLCAGGRAPVDTVQRLSERYRTHNGHILKVCSLLREHMRTGGPYLTFKEVWTLLGEALKTFGVEYHLRQNANKGAGTFPEIVTECEPNMYEPRPKPDASQQAEWDTEHKRIHEDIRGRRGIAVNKTVKTATVHEMSPGLIGLDF